ncbi:unnamed protein product, partial [Urochloa humidicola]
ILSQLTDGHHLSLSFLQMASHSSGLAPVAADGLTGACGRPHLRRCCRRTRLASAPAPASGAIHGRQRSRGAGPRLPPPSRPSRRRTTSATSSPSPTCVQRPTGAWTSGWASPHESASCGMAQPGDSGGRVGASSGGGVPCRRVLAAVETASSGPIDKSSTGRQLGLQRQRARGGGAGETRRRRTA